jgi:hypothetical protein
MEPTRGPNQEDELVVLLRALSRHGLREGDWVCSLRTRVTGQLAVECRGEQPRIVVQTDFGCVDTALPDHSRSASLADWQPCAPSFR